MIKYLVGTLICGSYILLLSLAALLVIEREILSNAGEINDEGTTSMMSDLITEQEKDIWMMQAFLG